MSKTKYNLHTFFERNNSRRAHQLPEQLSCSYTHIHTDMVCIDIIAYVQSSVEWVFCNSIKAASHCASFFYVL